MRLPTKKKTMQGNKNSPDVLNVFIEFQIIKESIIDSLVEELDVLIAAGKQVHLWSKTVSPAAMQKYCESILVERPEEEK